MFFLMNWRITVSWIWRLSLCVVALVVGYGGLRAVRVGTTNPDEIWKRAEVDLENGKLGPVDLHLRDAAPPRRAECRIHGTVGADGPLIRQCLSLGSVAQ
jgi:hypothetical protein